MKEDNQVNKITDEELQDYFKYRIFNIPSPFKTFYDSRTKKVKDYTLLILGYIMPKKDWVALRDIRKEFVLSKKIPYENTLSRLMKNLLVASIIEKEERIEVFSRSKPNKKLTNTYYRLSKNAFKKPIETKSKTWQAIKKRYIDLRIAKEWIAKFERISYDDVQLELDRRRKAEYGDDTVMPGSAELVKAEEVEPNATPEIVSEEEFMRQTRKDLKSKKSVQEFPQVSVKDFDDGKDD